MKGKRVKKTSRKKLVSVILALVLTFCAAGGTIAWLAASTNSVTNTFVPASVTNKVDETIDGAVKKNVTVTNTGDVSAYVRAAIVINWVDEQGRVTVPPAEATYSMSLNKEDWAEAGGYYYYNSVVAAGATTNALIKEVAETNAPSGYHLQVTIVAESIQAEGMGDDVKTAQQAWAKAADSAKNS